MTIEVSICIPIYNANHKMLQATIESALAQSEQYLKEIIVCDDSSDNCYLELIRLLNDDRIHFYRNKSNLGMVGNWNNVIRRSIGSHIILLGHDDLLPPDALEIHAETFARFSNIGLSSGNRELIDVKGEIVQKSRSFSDRTKIFTRPGFYRISGYECTAMSLQSGNAIGEPSATMFKRSVFDSVSGFSTDFRHSADVDFNIRVSKKSDIGFNTQIVIRRRIHQANLTKSNLSCGQITKERVMLWLRHQDSFSFPKSEKEEFAVYLTVKSAWDLARGLMCREKPLFMAGWQGVTAVKRIYFIKTALFIINVITRRTTVSRSLLKKISHCDNG